MNLDPRVHHRSTTGNLLNFRHSLRLAAKNSSNKKYSLQKAQELRCKKIKVINFASKAARLFIGTPADALFSEALPHSVQSQSPCTGWNSRVFETHVGIDSDASTMNVERDNAPLPKRDMPGVNSASPLRRDLVYLLTLEEIQFIKTVCGITKADAGVVPTCRIDDAGINGVNTSGM